MIIEDHAFIQNLDENAGRAFECRYEQVRVVVATFDKARDRDDDNIRAECVVPDDGIEDIRLTKVKTRVASVR